MRSSCTRRLGIRSVKIGRTSDRATLPAAHSLRNRDIAKALEELRGLQPTVADVAERAVKIRQLRQAANNQNRVSRAGTVDRPRRLDSLPTVLKRCRS